MGARSLQEISGIFGQNAANVDGEALRYVGEIAFQNANPIMSKFAAITLDGGTVDRLAASLEKKAIALKQVEDTFSQVVNTKDAYWGVAALYQMGYASEQYAQALENPPAIDGATKEDVLKELAPQIKERRDAAMSWYKAASDTVTKFKIYNEWSIKVLDAMARMENRTFTFDD
jgi:hypothetical protein